MVLDVVERITKARGLERKWQHGGRSSKGVLSAWESIIPELGTPEMDNINEFDLKGFFDNVEHSAVTEAFSDLGKIGTWISEVIKAKPQQRGRALSSGVQISNSGEILKTFKLNSVIIIKAAAMLMTMGRVTSESINSKEQWTVADLNPTNLSEIERPHEC